MKGLVVWLGAAAYFVGALLWLAKTRPLVEPIFEAGSVYNIAPPGLSLAYRYLGGRAAVLARPVEAGELSANGVVFRIRPRLLPPLRSAGSPLTPGEEEWIRGGGRLVVALATAYGDLAVQAAARGGAVLKVYPDWPSVQRVQPDPVRGLTGQGAAGAYALFASGELPVASRRSLGRGELVLLACPEVFENRLLGEADHLALLETLAGRGRSLYFDEHVHGLDDEAGLPELLALWRLGPALLLLALIAAVAFWRARVRVGPQQDLYQETRSDAVDLLDSLAQLHGRALRRDEALALYHASLGRAVAWKTGLRGEALAARLRELTGPPPPRREKDEMAAPDFARRLRRLNDGFRRLKHADTR